MDSADRGPTLKDVARLAEVSRATASRAFADHSSIAAATRMRVLDAARMLGYTLNQPARSLKSGRIGLVGVVLPDLRDPFYAHIAAGIDEVLQDQGFAMIMIMGRGGDQVAAIERLRSHRVGSVIVAPTSTAIISAIRAAKLVAVHVHTTHHSLVSDCVTGYDYEVVRGIAAELITLGHKRLALLLRSPETSATRGRAAGFLSAIDAAPSTVSGRLVAPHTDPRITSWLPHLDGASAVIAGDAGITSRLLQEARNRGVCVPRDLSVVSLGDLDWMTAFDPPISAVDLHPHAMGRHAAETLVARLRGDAPAPPVEIRVLPTVNRRGSIAPFRES
ncbi:LacI family DNA-binding transcriptional regulator [Microbacterium lacus]|uniref:LacI family DNA-binding transcriptional regulator n=1 Tax=Microbacterium lacus TaxID=415217 RepID=UPI0031D26C4E